MTKGYEGMLAFCDALVDKECWPSKSNIYIRRTGMLGVKRPES